MVSSGFLKMKKFVIFDHLGAILLCFLVIFGAWWACWGGADRSKWSKIHSLVHFLMFLDRFRQSESGFEWFFEDEKICHFWPFRGDFTVLNLVLILAGWVVYFENERCCCKKKIIRRGQGLRGVL